MVRGFLEEFQYGFGSSNIEIANSESLQAALDQGGSIYVSEPGCDVVGIRVENVETDTPCLSLFGNSFGSTDKRLAHAFDWSDQEGKLASWSGNAVSVSKEAHIGKLPGDADQSPFENV